MCRIRYFFCCCVLVAITALPARSAGVTLAWNASSDPTVVGYNVYYWTNGSTATNEIAVGNATSVTISNLVVGQTYYFAATTYNAARLESPFSATISYTPPPNYLPPTLNGVNDLTLNENAGPQVVNLSGITTGAKNQILNLTVLAASSNPGLIPDPVVNYASPNATGSLVLTPAPYVIGTSVISVTVDDGAPNNPLVTRTFTINVRSFQDTTRPGVQITAPVSNQQLTNRAFTVAGRASDNLAVGKVYWSLNGTAWATAATGNYWANWTTNVTLTPGTNILRAYAVDTSGNCSSTNTTRFVYLVRLPLTVRVQGQGSVNPNNNGAWLAVNENYSMTASAASGFAFTNWADGSGNVLTNRATLQFTMRTNLALMVNFTDVARPTLSLVTPTANLRVSNAVFNVTGKAGDNVAVRTVYYSLNGSSWLAASTGNNWTNWFTIVTLLPGTNTVRAYAADTSGNISPTNSSKVSLALSPPAYGAVGPADYANGRYNFMISGAVGYKYTVQASTDLLTWIAIGTNTVPSVFVDTNAGQFNQRFYRSIYHP